MEEAPNARHQTRAADGANRELTPVLSAMLTAGWLALQPWIILEDILTPTMYKILDGGAFMVPPALLAMGKWREGHEHDAQIAKGSASHSPSSISQHESTPLAENWLKT